MASGPTSNSFISQRLKLHYVDWGNRDAPPLLLVHGGRDHCRSWDWVAQELSRDWHVICPDLRGHGDSSWAPDGDYDVPYTTLHVGKMSGGVQVNIVPNHAMMDFEIRSLAGEDVAGLIRRLEAEAEGLDKVFTEFGAEWRFAGCSMCLGMNPDQLKPGERCASTSNRNFEGRQGYKGRTHLLSPAMAAAAAITGRLTDVRDLA